MTAARELEEETGYRARELEHVVDFEPAIGMVRTDTTCSSPAPPSGWVSRRSRRRCSAWSGCRSTTSSGLIRDGKILNSGTLVAFLYVLAARRPSAS